MTNESQSIIDKITNFKLQLVLNKNLYFEKLINQETYEIVENNLLEKITLLSNELELCT